MFLQNKVTLTAPPIISSYVLILTVTINTWVVTDQILSITAILLIMLYNQLSAEVLKQKIKMGYITAN